MLCIFVCSMCSYDFFCSLQLMEKRAASVAMNGKEVSFRMPYGATRTEIFHPSESVKVSYYERISYEAYLTYHLHSYIYQALYEFIFCSRDNLTSFGIFTMFPRRYIDPLGSEDIGHLPSRLAVELCGSFPDPLHFLGNEVGV